MRDVTRCSLIGLFATLAFAGVANAAFPLGRLISFDRVEADTNNLYEVTEAQGPWMILAASFSGETAQQDAHELLLELRREFKLEAYLWSKNYDFTERVQARGVDRYGRPIQARHAQAIQFEEWAVLVGNYQSIEARDLERDLERIKTLRPESLDIENGEAQTLRYGGLRSKFRLLTGETERGPMSQAFAVPNPKIPEEYFNQHGIDPLVVEMNEQVDHSLLTCPGRFTVQVAVFRGRNTIQQTAIAEIEAGRMDFESRLIVAAERAHLMTEALRAQGVEAYEYHDLQESTVCVGSFDFLYQLDPNQPYVLDELQRQRPNFAVDAQNRPIVHPEILDMIRRYAPEQRIAPDGRPIMGSEPRSIRVNDGQRVQTLSFDLSPIPVVVPKVTIGDEYARGGSGGGLFNR